MRSRILTGLGLSLSVLAVVVLARAFDAEVALDMLRRARLEWVAAAALLYLSLFPLRGLRWSVLLRDVKPVSTRSATEVFAIGFLANNVLPARLGDVARAFVLAEREALPASTSFANILLERVFDGLTVVAFLLGVLALAPPETAGWVKDVAGWMGALFAGAVTFAVVLVRNEALAVRLAAWTTRPLPAELGAKLRGVSLRLLKGLGALSSVRTTLTVAVLSVLIWAIEVGVYVLLAQAFGLALGLGALTLTMAVLTLGLTAPSAPAFVGVFEGLVVAALALYGVSTSEATAFALSLHLVHFVPGTLLGLCACARAGVRVGSLTSASRSGSDLPSEPPVALAPGALPKIAEHQ